MTGCLVILGPGSEKGCRLIPVQRAGVCTTGSLCQYMHAICTPLCLSTNTQQLSVASLSLHPPPRPSLLLQACGATVRGSGRFVHDRVELDGHRGMHIAMQSSQTRGTTMAPFQFYA